MNTNPNQQENHFDEIACLQYLEGQLERAKALELSAHAEHCGDCRSLLGALERESRLLTRSMREEEEPVPSRLFTPARERMPWAWIISFGMAAAGSYWLWTTIIDPWRAQLNEAGFGGTNLVTMLFFQGALWKGWGSMWTFVQVMAVISMCGVGFILLRRGLRQMNTIALVMSVLAVALLLPTSASAAEVHKNEPNYTLASGETVNNDLIVFGKNIRIDGTVNGDLIAFGANITVNGHITGDVLSAGQMLQINGIVDGNVRFGGSMLTLRGKIGKNLMTACGTVLSDSSSEIGWGATIAGGDVTLGGRIGRDLMTASGHLGLDGFVGGNVKVQAGQDASIGSNAQVKGVFEYEGPKQPDVASGAKLASPIDVKIVEHTSRYASRASLWSMFLQWSAAFIFGLVFFGLAPGVFSESASNAGRFGISIGIGFLFWVGIFVASVIACITVVGLGVGLSSLVLLAIAIYGAKIVVAAWIGNMLLRQTPSTGAIIGGMALGLAIEFGIRELPYAAWWFTIPVAAWGFGAFCITLYGRIRSRGASAVMPATAA
jgi:cytoskeletal protein CcmA (bactofilin family)